MFKIKRTQSTLVFFFVAILVALPLSGNAQNSIYNHGEDFTSHIYTWEDPIYPTSVASKVTLRSATSSVEAEGTILIDGDILDATDNALVEGAHITCLDKNLDVVALTETDASGSYQFRVPKGKYTLSVSKLKYVAVDKEVVISDDAIVNLNFYLSLVKTSAGNIQVLTGLLAEGNQRDITLENSKIAMCIADGSLDQQLGMATKGKPIDLSTTSGEDGFDWLNMPLISTQKLSGIPGSIGSQSKNVQFNTVQILSSTANSSKVLATGECTNLPLKVKNLYVVKPDKEWFDVTTTIQNTSDTVVSFWLGDAMDNDEEGQTSVYPMRRFGSTVIVSTDQGLDEFIPAEPWMGCFGESNQVFGIFYKGDYAKDFLISANTYRTVSQKLITIQPGATYVFGRQVAAVSVREDQMRTTALRSCFDSSYDEWGLASTLQLDKTNMTIGDTITCSLSITNISKYNVFENVSASICLPPFWKGNADTLYYGDLGPLKSVVATWKLVPTEGSGNTIISAQALAWDEPFTYTEKSVFVSGDGWYAGDNHLHTKFSDGWATVSDNVNAAKTIGLSFLCCTEHNTNIQDSAVKANCNSEFLVMPGCEITPNYKQANNWGHALSLFSEKVIQFSNSQSLKSAQDIVDNINALDSGHGFAIMAHPYLKGCPWVYTNVSGFKGVEVWSCFTPIHGLYSTQAFALWDKINNSGLKQYGFADSDAHNLDMVGRPHIVAHLKNLSPEEVENAERKGQFYGSNGPAIRFTVDTVSMGGLLPVNSKHSVKISMKAYSPQGIDSMYVFKNGVLIRGFSYYDFMPEVQQVVYDEAVPGDFYRMECTDRWSQFAFSNPVFIVPAEQVTPHTVDSVSTGLKNIKLNISLSPNPGSDYVKLKTDKPTNALVSIYDTSSKLWLKSSFSNESEKTLDVRSLPRGLYIVKINENRLKLIIR
jgi:hypothetical protein